MRKRIRFTAGGYHDAGFFEARWAERQVFHRGRELVFEFEGRDRYEGFGMARRAAMIYAGLLLKEKTLRTWPFVSELGPYRGYVVGSQTPDTKQGWRIDWNKETKELHINWWDRRLDRSPRGDRDRSVHYYGGNYVVGSSQDLFWELLSHFPGQVSADHR